MDLGKCGGGVWAVEETTIPDENDEGDVWRSGIPDRLDVTQKPRSFAGEWTT